MKGGGVKLTYCDRQGCLEPPMVRDGLRDRRLPCGEPVELCEYHDAWFSEDLVRSGTFFHNCRH